MRQLLTHDEVLGTWMEPLHWRPSTSAQDAAGPSEGSRRLDEDSRGRALSPETPCPWPLP